MTTKLILNGYNYAMSSPEYINNAIKVYTSFEYVQQLLWEDHMHHIALYYLAQEYGQVAI